MSISSIYQFQVLNTPSGHFQSFKTYFLSAIQLKIIMSASQSLDSVANQPGEFRSRVPLSEPLETKGISEIYFFSLFAIDFKSNLLCWSSPGPLYCHVFPQVLRKNHAATRSCFFQSLMHCYKYTHLKETHDYHA